MQRLIPATIWLQHGSYNVGGLFSVESANMKILCPSCSQRIRSNGLNVEADVAVCSACDEAFLISELLEGKQIAEPFKFSRPPPGAWFYETYDGWTLGASTRSSTAITLVPFMGVWSGFSLGVIYGKQIAAGAFNWPMSLFGIPFLATTIYVGAIAMMTLCGQVVITVRQGEGCLFTGVGPLGWSRRFDWDSIKRVREEPMETQSPGTQGMLIALVGTTELKFGSMIIEPRREFMVRALRKLMANRSGRYGAKL